MNIFHQNNNVKKMKKGKLIMTIIIGLMCLILTMLIFMQVKTISQTNISELEIMRESELKTEITALKTKYEETAIKIKETNEKILEYEEAATEGNGNGFYSKDGTLLGTDPIDTYIDTSFYSNIEFTIDTSITKINLAIQDPTA